jgi:hypothetical protein
MRLSLIALATLAPLALAGCTTSQYEKDPMYTAGFGDGCSTGTSRAQGAPPSNAVRDEVEWKSSDAYRAGWKAGYGACNDRGGRGDTTGLDRDPTRP